MKGNDRFQRLLEAARRVQAKLLFLPLTAVGGTAAALYARHRVSLDVDFVTPYLKERFSDVEAALETMPDFEPLRIRRPVLILGRVGEDEVGIRQLRRDAPLDVIEREGLCLPTLPEMIRIKAFLLSDRRAVRDFVDLAALLETAGMTAALQALVSFDNLYSGLTKAGALVAFAEATHDEPVDADLVDVKDWRFLRPEYQDMNRVRQLCQELAMGALENAGRAD